jgi:phage terminase small subunit
MAQKNKDALSAKQEMFCFEYIKDLDATKAAIRAGYSAKTADVKAAILKADPRIAAKIQELMNQRVKRTEIDADYVLNKIKETVERCSQAEPVYEFVDGKKEPTGEWKFEHNGVLKGCELLGKHLKLFTDKIEHSGKMTLEQLILSARKKRNEGE